MRGHDYPDPIDTPDDDQPTGKRVKCWACSGFKSHWDEEHGRHRCETCKGTGYTYETTETEEAEDANRTHRR